MPLRAAMDRIPLLAVGVAALVLLWGGFFNGVTNAYGIVACAVAGIMALRDRDEKRGLSLVGLLMAGVAASYFMSAVVHGMSLTTLSETGTWAAFAATAFWAASLDAEGHAACLNTLTWFGVATALAGFLTRASVLPIYNGMDGTRLQFTFQYANGAGAWYGIVTLLCLLSPDASLRSLVALPVAALLHTQSAGSILVFAVVAVVLAGVWARSGEWERILAMLADGLLGFALFAVLRFAPVPVGACAVALAVLMCTVAHERVERELARCDARMCSLAAAGALAIGAIVAAMFLRERVADATASFAERLCQIGDGLRLWVSNPLWGVGPDRWQYCYRAVQTAPYTTSVVHNSYVQLLLDAGVVGFAFLVFAIAVGMWTLTKAKDQGWRVARMAAAAFMLLHMLLDFDLSFGALACMLVVVLCDADCPRVGERDKGGTVATVACLALCLAGSFGGLYADLQTKALDDAQADGDVEAYLATYERSALTQRDEHASDGYAVALYTQGSYDEVIALVEGVNDPSDETVLYAALSCYQKGLVEQGGLLLIEQMQRRPYDEPLYRSAKVIIDERGLESSLVERYNAVVDRANVLIGQSAGLPVGWQPLDTYV